MTSEDVAFWDNVTTATEYVIEIVTTFSGVGNIAKFRHLAKVASKANKLKFVSRTGKVLANAKAAARATVGVIEISSGTVNALLKITDQRDEPWAKELSEFLLILEICSLGADLGEFLLKRARTSAKNALKYEKEISKQLDDVVINDGKTTRKLSEADKAKFLDELNEVAEVERRLTNTWDGGKLLSERILRKRIRTLLQEYKNFNLEIHIVDDVKDAERIADWNARNVLGSFRSGPPPKIYLRKEVTELTLQHEVWHLEDLKKLGSKKYHTTSNWKKEELVWERIWQTKNRWTEEEIVDSYRYYLKSCDKEAVSPKLIKELEELLQQPYYKNIRYKR